jgi:hypothetical protein
MASSKSESITGRSAHHGGGLAPEVLELQPGNPRRVAIAGTAHCDGIDGPSQPQPAPGLAGMPELVMGHRQEQRLVGCAAGAMNLDRSHELPDGLWGSPCAVQDGSKRVQPFATGAAGGGHFSEVDDSRIVFDGS